MCTDCLYEEAIELAQEMLDDPRYEFADRFVRSTFEWVKKNEHVTDRQRSALENVKNSVKDKDDL